MGSHECMYKGLKGFSSLGSACVSSTTTKPVKLVFGQINRSIEFRMKEDIVYSNHTLPGSCICPGTLLRDRQAGFGAGRSGDLSCEGCLA